MMKHAEHDKTTVIEVVSFLFFTLFAMILAFFTSAKAFATPVDGLCGVDPSRNGVVIAPCTGDESVGASFSFGAPSLYGLPHR